MPLPDYWDRRGRSEAVWTEVAWRGRIAWRTCQDFGSQLVCESLHPVHQRGHLVGEMTLGPLYNHLRHLRTALGCPTTPCLAQRTWPKTRPWGRSGLRGSGWKDSEQRDGDVWPIGDSATDRARHRSKLAAEPGVGDKDSSFVTKNNGSEHWCDHGLVRV